jgi:integrase/recombinase XerD
MATARPFADMLAQFLTIYLPVTRACSPNTVSAYRVPRTWLSEVSTQGR